MRSNPPSADTGHSEIEESSSETTDDPGSSSGGPWADREHQTRALSPLPCFPRSSGKRTKDSAQHGTPCAGELGRCLLPGHRAGDQHPTQLRQGYLLSALQRSRSQSSRHVSLFGIRKPASTIHQHRSRWHRSGRPRSASRHPADKSGHDLCRMPLHAIYPSGHVARGQNNGTATHPSCDSLSTSHLQ